MRLILAVSADGFLATGPDDDMSWTGPDDKAAFRLLTSVGGVYGAGSTTFDQMPALPGRRGYRITRNPGSARAPLESSMTLGRFAHAFPDAWLLGGPTVALEALRTGMVDQVYLCRTDRALWPSSDPSADAIRDEVTPWLMSRGEMQNAGTAWRRAQRIKFGEITVDAWRPLCPIATARQASGAG
jgi:dihydrofolate reductase